jgi:hypothetical protein
MAMTNGRNLWARVCSWIVGQSTGIFRSTSSSHLLIKKNDFTNFFKKIFLGEQEVLFPFPLIKALIKVTFSIV